MPTIASLRPPRATSPIHLTSALYLMPRSSSVSVCSATPPKPNTSPRRTLQHALAYAQSCRFCASRTARQGCTADRARRSASCSARTRTSASLRSSSVTPRRTTTSRACTTQRRRRSSSGRASPRSQAQTRSGGQTTASSRSQATCSSTSGSPGASRSRWFISRRERRMGGGTLPSVRRRIPIGRARWYVRHGASQLC